MTALPYGSWPSPVSAADLTRASLRLSGGRVVDGVRYWSEGYPEQRGRVSLWRQRAGEDPVELTPEAYLRTAVNEYGGGDWTVADELVAYCSWPDGGVFLIEADGTTRRLATGGGYRYAALALHPAQGVLLAVREDHTDPSAEPVTTVVAFDLASDGVHDGTVLCAGADFYAHPSLSADGRLTWCQWNHPDMPWDAAQVLVAPLAAPTQTTLVAGGPGVSALYPSWLADDTLVYLDDRHGYWNFQHWDGGQATALWPAPNDFCGPLWVLTPAPYAVIDAGRIGCSWLADGIARVGVLHFGDGPSRLEELDTEAVTAEITGAGPTAIALFGYADRPAELVEIDWDVAKLTTLRRSSEFRLDPALISRAVPISWESIDGTVHAWFYPPTNGDLIAPDGELPPVQVWSHGGPTAYSGPDFALSVQYWTTRGIGILDVNYSGSTGYGRAYRDRLNGAWGLSDIRDCVDGARALVEQGLADPTRLSIRGSSAGGFTTLAALTGSEVFAAGVSLYGIGDLETLATDTHKFEAHYLDGLVGSYPQARQVYLDRSPIHHLDQLSCPMLLLQGTDDKVVPPSQAEAMAAAVRAKGLRADLVLFDDEGHGFRQAETVIKVAELSLAFLADVHGFIPA